MYLRFIIVPEDDEFWLGHFPHASESLFFATQMFQISQYNLAVDVGEKHTLCRQIRSLLLPGIVIHP